MLPLDYIYSKIITVTHKDRFIRFGYEWFERFCKKFNTTIVIVNNEELLHAAKGFVSIKKQIERDEEIAEELQNGNKSNRGAESQDS